MGRIIRYGTSVSIVETYEKISDVKLGPKTLERVAAVTPVAQYSDKYLYVVARAVSGYEKWGPNDNGDSFEWEELLKAYPTFIRGGVYRDHNNQDRKQAIGIILDAWPDMEGQYIDVLMAINKKKAPREVAWIKEGTLDSVSMGCVVDEAICSICGNVARDESEYCEHVRNGMKGRIIGGKLCHEFNRGVRFFEVSLISPYSEAADPEAKIKQTLASKDTDEFEEWIVETSFSDVKESDLLDSFSYQIGDQVYTQDGSKGVIVGTEGMYPKVAIGKSRVQLFDPKTLTIVKGVNEMASDVIKQAQGTEKEEFGRDHPNKANPTTGRWGGDYGSPAEKYEQDFNRTEVESESVDLRGSQVSSQIERPDYLHKGKTSGEVEGPMPKKASVDELEKQLEEHLKSTAEKVLELEQVKKGEAVKKSFMSRLRQALGIEREAAEDYGRDAPARGNPSTMRDAGDYQESEKYYAAQKEEGDTKAVETKKDIDAQRPYTYSNTLENIYTKLPKVAMSVKEITDKLKEIFGDEQKAATFAKTLSELNDKEVEDVLKMIAELEAEEKEETEGKPAPLGMPSGSKVAAIYHIRLALAHKKLAALGDWGNEDPVAHAKRMILQQITRDPTTNIQSMFMLASSIRNLNEEQKAKLSKELGLAKEAALDYKNMTKEELIGALKYAKAMGDLKAENSILNALLSKKEDAPVRKTAASWDEIIPYIVEQMKKGRSYQDIKAEIDEKFDITPGSKKGPEPKKAPSKEPAMGPGGSFMPEPGNASELTKSPSEGGYLSSGSPSQTGLWGGETPGAMNEREIGRSSSVKTAGRSLKEWVAELEKKGAPAKVIRQFQHIWNSAIEDGKSEEYAARAAIDKLPKEYLEEPTEAHGPGKSGSKKTAAELLNDYDITKGTGARWNATTKELADESNQEQKKDFIAELKEARKKELLARQLEVTAGRSLKEWVAELKKKGAPAKVIRQFQHIWNSAIEDGKSEAYAARAAIDKLPKEYLEKPTKVHGPGKSGPKKTAAADEHFYDISTSSEPKAPSSELAAEENKKQDADFKNELKQATGVRIGQPIKVVVGTGEEHLGNVAEVYTDENVIVVDYDDIRNRDAINLTAGKSKVYGEAHVFTRPEIVTVKKGNWIAYGDGKSWNLYNFKRSASKLAEVKLADVDIEEVANTFNLKDKSQVPAFFAGKEYGEAVLDKTIEAEAQGAFNTEAGTGLSVDSTESDINVGDEVVIAPDWLPTGEETEELVNDVVNLKNENVPGIVEQITAEGSYVVDFGGEVPIVLTAAEIRKAKDDSLTYGTDVRWSEETKELADEENSEQEKEYQKEQVLSSFGPDSRHHTVMAAVNVSEAIQFMKKLVEDAGLKIKDALTAAAEAFEMTEEEVNKLVNSDEYIKEFETPKPEESEKQEPEKQESEKLEQLKAKMAGLKKRLCIRIAEDMADKGLIEGLDINADPTTREQAIERQVSLLMRLDQDGLYEFEKAVKSASDPSGVEAMKQIKVGPEEGTLKQALAMRGVPGIRKDGLDDPNFFM